MSIINKKTTTLVLGGSGQTGRRLVEQLLEQNQNVKVIVRSKERFLETISTSQYGDGDGSTSNGTPAPNLTITQGTILEMSDQDIMKHVKGCDAVVSCLGHTLDMKGIYGKPRKLCTDTIKRIYQAIETLHHQEEQSSTIINQQLDKPSSTKTKLILMSSNAVANPNGFDNRRPLNERILIGMIRALIPPHRDNEEAAAFLYETIKHDDKHVQWVAVRPDDLIEGNVSEYNIFDKPQQGLFGGGTTTRANVAHFMCNLILKAEAWDEWKHKMPVIMNVPDKK